ncbi:MAG: hypothetical protein RSC76_07750 [Oscillospiraceae bacterium]
MNFCLRGGKCMFDEVKRTGGVHFCVYPGGCVYGEEHKKEIATRVWSLLQVRHRTAAEEAALAFWKGEYSRAGRAAR